MRFSLRALLLAVPVVALGISGFIFNLAWATSLIYTICVAAMLLAVVGALFARGERRLFWAGFAALGWGYWWLAFEPGRTPVDWQEHPSQTSSGQMWYYATSYSGTPKKEYRFITADLLDLLERYIVLPRRIGDRVMAQWGGPYYSAVIVESQSNRYQVKWDDGSKPTWVTSNQIQPLRTVSRIAGHSLFCLLFAVMGGAAAVWLLTDRRDNSKDATVRPLPAHE